jgi:Calcineurin-like phosphoesterase
MQCANGTTLTANKCGDVASIGKSAVAVRSIELVNAAVRLSGIQFARQPETGGALRGAMLNWMLLTAAAASWAASSCNPTIKCGQLSAHGRFLFAKRRGERPGDMLWLSHSMEFSLNSTPILEQSMSTVTSNASSAGVSLLFRYRDLVAPTLNEHRDIITAQRSCWWGWWKRPSEDARMAVWDQLASMLAASGSNVRIGLFDSGSNVVHFATVAQVIPPKLDGDGQCEYVAVPADEENLIPDYYRRSPFSRAWFRLTQIDTAPRTFFGEYSFREPPPLPLFKASSLSHLKGKVIDGAEELRSMDTTIWEVRKRTEGDREGRAYISASHLFEPVIGTPTRAPGNAILHITDTHFATGPHRGQHVWRLEGETADDKMTLAEAVGSAIKAAACHIGIVIVTGDLTFAGTTDEFEEAAKSLRRLLGLLDLWNDNLVVVPGNHDINWTNATDGATGPHPSTVQVAPEDAKKNYRSFFSSLFGYPSHPTLAMARRYILPHGGTIEICAMNSSSLEQGKSFFPGMGRIQAKSFETTSAELGWAATESLALRVIALHHHLVATESIENHDEYYKGFGMAIDAPGIQRNAARRGVQLALHGHRHRSFVWRSTVYDLPERAYLEPTLLGDMLIVGGGSAGSPEVEARANYFNVIETSSRGVKLRPFRSESAGNFREEKSLRSALEVKEGRLNLGPWSRE